MSRLAAVEAERRLLDAPRASAYIGISRAGFLKMVAAGEFVKVQIGARVLFDRHDLDAWIDAKKRAV